MIKHKMTFHLQVVPFILDGVHYDLVRLTKAPERSLLDKAFFVAIVLVLFLTMVGMGVTLTLNDFAQVFKKPLGIIIGLICQFGLMPLAAMALGILSGFHEHYPFIYLGMILVAASPGGVISNLMTYLGKGDVALSVSLTAICTVLAFAGTPLLLTLYGGNIPDFTVPAGDVFKTMLVLVIVPLLVGMTLRAKLPKLAKILEKPLAALGVFTLLLLIVVGVWSNTDAIVDTDRYGFKFYSIVLCLTLAGMLLGGGAAKLFRISNFQARAISLEVGLRNASLSMTIAILLQDRVGDFAASMFVTSGVFGIFMYVAGALTIFGFRFLLPVQPSSHE
jgi:BASS family bile acid:Na+ symporter